MGESPSCFPVLPHPKEDHRTPDEAPGEVWRGRSPSACQSYPAASPTGRDVFRSAENFPYSLERPGAKRPARGCKTQKSGPQATFLTRRQAHYRLE